MKAYHFVNQQLDIKENKWMHTKGEFFTSKQKCFDRITDHFHPIYQEKEKTSVLNSCDFMESYDNVLLSFEYQWFISQDYTNSKNIGKRVLQRITVYIINIQ